MGNLKVGIIVSQFNAKISELMKNSALDRCKELGLKRENYCLIEVPGAIEIPVIAKKMALTKKITVIVGLGAIIKGDTDHYNYVCNQVSYGCQKIAIEEAIPIIFGILTCFSEQQVFDRLGGKEGNKAKEAIDTAIYMAKLMDKVV
jgi:6,7-dimethyl-8-ribityllumazine synthase